MSLAVVKGNHTTIENDLFLFGEGEHTGICFIQVNVGKMLESDIFRSHNPHLIPYFEKALEIMETWDDSVDEVPVIINSL